VPCGPSELVFKLGFAVLVYVVFKILKYHDQVCFYIWVNMVACVVVLLKNKYCGDGWAEKLGGGWEDWMGKWGVIDPPFSLQVRWPSWDLQVIGFVESPCDYDHPKCADKDGIL
jgi:hypothetical protein